MSCRIVHEIVPALLAEDLVSGQVIVASEIRGHGRVPLECAAAPLLTGLLRRAGIPTMGQQPLLGAAGATGGVPVALAVWSGAVRHDTVFAVAARIGDGAALAAAKAAVSAWAAVVAPRSVLLASPRSFCAGVERAIQIVQQLLVQRGGPVFVRKQIVHNTHVVAELEGRGAVFVEDLREVPAGATVVFSAHGVSPQVHARAAERGLEVVDATCPLVTKVHVQARRFAGRGDTVVLIGHAGHEEVEGTFGEAPEHTVLIQTPADVDSVVVADPGRVSYLTQTTLAVDETAEIIAALREKFPALRGPATADICYATTNRQHALETVAADSDLVLVVGSDNSSNSQRLVELTVRHGTPAYLIEDASEIRPQWLATASTIGLTAGASAPPALVSKVITALGGLGPVTVTECEFTTETIHFALPRTVRTP